MIESLILHMYAMFEDCILHTSGDAVLAGENGACLFFVSSCYRVFCGCLGVLCWYQVSTGLLHSFLLTGIDNWREFSRLLKEKNNISFVIVCASPVGGVTANKQRWLRQIKIIEIKLSLSFF